MTESGNGIVNTRQPKLFLDVPDMTSEAKKTYAELDICTYTPKNLGDSKHEFMECDCFEEFRDGLNHACGEDSDCINRATLIECVNGLCKHSCGTDCQNQRFQKKAYADISVFKTERKGFGVRANSDIEPHNFIYEYIGEVIQEEEFRNRMVKYDQMGFKHFYFMMLQTGQFIDATLKGCIARFCNHSCNPNAYVNKWVVNGKLKMGIFANRHISKGEEVTFDYNVDRYGANAQPCYCEEPNCIGFLGGKTQTDAASLLPQSFADALGIRPSMEKKWINMMKAKGEKIAKSDTTTVNVDFVNSLSLEPCTKTEDVNRVMSVLLQIDDAFIAEKLLERITLTEDEAMHYQFIKLHGYLIFSRLIAMFEDKPDVIWQILNFLLVLPKTTKNGIIHSGIDKKVEQLKNTPKFEVICEDLLEKWSKYETYTRISKKDISENSKVIDLRRIRLPIGWEIIHENGRPVYYNAQRQIKQANPPTDSAYRSNSSHNLSGVSDPKSRSATPSSNTSRYSGSVKYIPTPTYGQMQQKRTLSPEEYEKRKKSRIEWEQKELELRKLMEQEALKAKLDQETQKKSELERIIEEANKQKELERLEKLKQQQEDEERKKVKKQASHVNAIENKWVKFFAQHVPNLIKNYQKDVGKDVLKESARNIVKSLTQKELKKDSSRSPPEELSKEKRAKVKTFSMQYMDRLVAKMKEKKEKKR
ncbi:Set2 [Kluyveromyces lactis]|nr:Set2 [Kluyveromyces lactis]